MLIPNFTIVRSLTSVIQVSMSRFWTRKELKYGRTYRPRRSRNPENKPLCVRIDVQSIEHNLYRGSILVHTAYVTERMSFPGCQWSNSIFLELCSARYEKTLSNMTSSHYLHQGTETNVLTQLSSFRVLAVCLCSQGHRAYNKKRPTHKEFYNLINTEIPYDLHFTECDVICCKDTVV